MFLYAPGTPPPTQQGPGIRHADKKDSRAPKPVAPDENVIKHLTSSVVDPYHFDMDPHRMLKTNFFVCYLLVNYSYMYIKQKSYLFLK